MRERVLPTVPAVVLWAVAGLSGAGVMVLELMGVRLMAPHFGQSQIVWTNVIGVVLAALAVGQWWGGRLAEAGKSAGALVALFAAGTITAVLPELIRGLAILSMPSELRLDEAAPFVSRGSLLVALVALGIPLLALGVVTPCLVRLSRGVETRPGAVTGRLLGAGTLGSLLGTFSATHLLLPSIGSASAMRVGAALLLLAAALLWWFGVRAPSRAAMLGLLPIVVLPLPALFPDNDARWTLLDERETEYQYVRVLEDGGGRRWLALNEGLDSFHSVLQPGELLTGDYYDAFLLPSLLATSTGASDQDPGKGDRSEHASGTDVQASREVLVLGLAAGTMARQLLALEPTARVTGVELDAELLEVGAQWFELPSAVETLGGVDGRVVLEYADRSWGAILVDAFSNQIYVPPQLATVEAFEALRDRLVPGGWVALNLSARGIEDPVAHAVIGTFARVFPGSGFLRVPGTRNLFVLGRRGGLEELPPASARRALDAVGLLPDLEWLLDRAAWASPPLLTDDELLADGFAPLESLAHRAWVGEWVASSRPRVEIDETEVADDEHLLRLDRVRVHLKRTEWAEAQALLELGAPGGAGGDWFARRELLWGNLLFERGEWNRAQAAYESVGLVSGGDIGLDSAAEENLSFVHAAIDQEARRSREVGALTIGIVSLLLGFTGLCVWGSWATRSSEAAQLRQPLHRK